MISQTMCYFEIVREDDGFVNGISVMSEPCMIGREDVFMNGISVI